MFGFNGDCENDRCSRTFGGKFGSKLFTCPHFQYEEKLRHHPNTVVINSKTIDTRLNIGKGGGSYISIFCK